jgi:hypothetical protein
MQGKARKLPSKYSSLKPKVKAKVKIQSRSPSPTPSQSVSNILQRTMVSPSRPAPKQPSGSTEEENDEKDEKLIVKLMKSTLPTFSNEAD